jgi:hypothetical protein
MRRLMISGVLTALLLAPAIAEAQSAIGFRGGIRSASLETDQTVTALDEMVLGAYLGFGLSDRLAFQAELVYGTRGAGGLGLGADALDGTATPVRVDMRYIEVPLLLRAGFPGERLLPSFFAGPYVAFLLSCEVTPDGGSAGACDDDAAAQRFAPRSTDFGMVAGLGLDVAIGESTLFIDGRYTFGIASIQAGGNAFDARHNGMAVTGGFAVPLGR